MSELESLKSTLLGAAQADAAVKMAEAILAHAGRVGGESEPDSQPFDVQKVRTRELDTIAAVVTLAGNFDYALELTRRMTYDRARNSRLQRIAMAQAKAGKFDAAFSTLLEISEIGDEDFRTYPRREIVKAQAEVGEFVGAIAMAQRIEEQRSRGNVLRELAIIEAKQGQFAAAIEIAKGIEVEYFQVLALAEIARSQAQAAEQEEAQTTIAAASRAMREIADGVNQGRAMLH